MIFNKNFKNYTESAIILKEILLLQLFNQLDFLEVVADYLDIIGINS